CIFTRARFFRGHEWLTYFGNRELGEAERFDDSEVQWMALGNRRVDYPKELLVHLDNGILAYVSALMDRTEQPEEQPHHFLLSAGDSELAAADAAREHILAVTEDALRQWNTDRVRALTLLGQAQHTVQDSFSPAHTVRQSDVPNYGLLPSDVALATELGAGGDAGPAPVPCQGECGCISRVKAYLRRDEEFRAGILYHGTEEDTIGHITTEDSIYRQGRGCHRPLAERDVFECLNQHARQGVLGTMAFLRWARSEIAAGNVGDGLSSEALRAGFEVFAGDYLRSCE
ncbi:MAG TPA: hypothetical protein VMG12_18950, partial [Polyangiaceae bacterium]|nr:hypothetical protein [Polyangiaceae bacterium]